jgi:hypothetical protein
MNDNYVKTLFKINSADKCCCGGNPVVQSIYSDVVGHRDTGYLVFCDVCFDETEEKHRHDLAVIDWNNGNIFGHACEPGCQLCEHRLAVRYESKIKVQDDFFS